MATTSWLRWLKGQPRPGNSPAPRARFAPRLHPLEDRTVPSTFVVNTTADTVDANPGDGLARDAAGKTSLRAAIMEANADPGADGITFAPWVHGAITLNETLGALPITDSLTIAGPGAGKLAVSGNDKVRVFYVSPGTTAAISQLTITHGKAETNETVLHSHGGGVLNDGTLTLSGVVLSDNKAVGVEDVAPPDEPRHLGGGAGGGVGNRGQLTVVGCTFVGNQALGAAHTDGVFAIRDGLSLSAVKFPGLGIGGGLWNWESGSATVTDTSFIDNKAVGGDYSTGTFAGLGQGGAIYNDNYLKVTGTLFGGNQAVGGSHTISDIFSGAAVGGGISSGTNERLIGHATSAVLAVDQSAFIGNQAVGGSYNLAGPQGVATGAGGGFGGGIFVFQGVATVSGTTLTGNLAVGGTGADGKVGGLAIGGGIIFVNFLGPVTGTVADSALLLNEAVGGAGGAGARAATPWAAAWPPAPSAFPPSPSPESSTSATRG